MIQSFSDSISGAYKLNEWYKQIVNACKIISNFVVCPDIVGMNKSGRGTPKDQVMYVWSLQWVYRL